MADANITFEPLLHLLKVSSKDQVQKLCNQAFLYRDLIKPPEEAINKVSENVGIEKKDASELLSSLSGLIKHVLFIMCNDAASVATVFPEDFHKNLTGLLSKIIAENLSSWRTHSVNNQISLPRLVDFGWRVDIKTSSDSLTRMSVPTCILQLQIKEDVQRSDAVPETKTMNVELSKEKLDTMLDGLGKIRDQLNSVAGRK